MLTKTSYVTGLKCVKKMMLDKTNKQVISAEIEENAKEFEKLVQSSFKGILKLQKQNTIEEDVKLTNEELKKGTKIIAEATFKSSDMMCRIDILEKTDKGYNIYEIKSSTTEKEDYLNDLAYQYYVISHVLKVNKAYLVQPRKINPNEKIEKMIEIKDKTIDVFNMQTKVAIKTLFLKEEIKENRIPNEEITINCRQNGQDCPYLKEKCLKGIKKGSIFDMSNFPFEKKVECYNRGIITKEDILKHPEIVDKIKPAELKDEKTVNKEEIKKTLDKIKYPISYLDFETISYLVPKYKNHTVNSKIIIQYSLHIKEEDKELIHKYALEKPTQDPRRKIAEKLVEDVPKTGSVIVYHAAFESSVIENLANSFEDLKTNLLSIKERIVDLEVIFKNKFYYDPLFYGSSSIKVVLPTLFPDDSDLNYKKFKHVHNGLEAASFLRQENYSEEIRNDLLEYCYLDTLAMVKIHEKMKEIIK